MKRFSLILFCLISTLLCLSGCKSKEVPAPAAEAPAAEAPAALAAEAPAEAAPEAAPAEAAPEAAPTPEAAPAPKYVDENGNPIGAILVNTYAVTDPVSIIKEVNADGTYRIHDMADGLLVYGTERLPLGDKSEAAVKAAFDRLASQARDVEIVFDKDATALLGRTTWKWTYTTGNNEDTRENIDYYVMGDSFDYRFHTSVNPDFVDGVAEMRTAMFKSLKIEVR